MFKLSHIWAVGLLILPFFSVSGIPFPYIYPKIFLLQFWAAIGLIFSIIEFKKEDLAVGPIFLSGLGLFILSLISSFYAADMVAAFFGPFWRGTGIFFYLSCLIIWFNLNTNDYPKEKFGRLIVYAGLIISIVSLFYRLNGQVGSSFTTLMGNQNALSFWIGATLFLNFHYRKVLGQNKFLYFGTFALCSLAVILLGSRSTLGGILGGGLIIALFSNRKLLKSSLIALTALLFGIGLQHFIANQSLILDIIARFKRFHRKDIWLGAWDSFTNHPFLGYGFHGLIQGYWENFPSKIDPVISWNDNAHSLPLNLLGEMGILSLFILGLIVFYFIKALKNKEKDERAFWIGLAFYITCYCLVQPFYIDTVLLMVFIAFLFSEKTKFSFNSKNKVWILFQASTIVTLLIISCYQIGQLGSINKTRKEIVSNKNYRKTWNQFMKEPSFLDKPGALLEVSNQMGAAFKGNTKYLISLRRPMTSFMLDQYQRNFESFSERPRMYENYANWLSRGEKYMEAILILDKSLDRSDKITKSIYQKASIYVKLKDYKKAKEMLLRVKELNPNYPNVDSYLVKLKNY